MHLEMGGNDTGKYYTEVDKPSDTRLHNVARTASDEIRTAHQRKRG